MLDTQNIDWSRIRHQLKKLLFHLLYIVLAESEQEAKRIVEVTEEYSGEEERRKHRNEESSTKRRIEWLLKKWYSDKANKHIYSLGICETNEIPLTESKIVWKVFNFS